MNILHEFAQYSGAHGLKYLTHNFPILSRLIWSLIVISGFFITGVLLADHFYKWDNQPLIATIDEFSVPAGEIPFPSVTICPESTFLDNWAFVEKVANLIHKRHTCALVGADGGPPSEWNFFVPFTFYHIKFI